MSEIQAPSRPPFAYSEPDFVPEPEEIGTDDQHEPLEAVEVPDPDPDGLYDEWPPDVFYAELPEGGAYTQPPAVPEPGTGVLFGAGLIGLAAQRRSVRLARMRRLRSDR